MLAEELIRAALYNTPHEQLLALVRDLARWLQLTAGSRAQGTGGHPLHNTAFASAGGTRCRTKAEIVAAAQALEAATAAADAHAAATSTDVSADLATVAGSTLKLIVPLRVFARSSGVGTIALRFLAMALGQN